MSSVASHLALMATQNVSRCLSMLLLLAATGCAGRWMAVPQPSRMGPTTVGPGRDYRVVLRNDSTVVLRNAVVRHDSIVELPSGQTNRQRAGPARAVALAEAAHVEFWQSQGERVGGGISLTLVGALAAFITVLALTWRSD